MSRRRTAALLSALGLVLALTGVLAASEPGADGWVSVLVAAAALVLGAPVALLVALRRQANRRRRR